MNMSFISSALFHHFEKNVLTIHKKFEKSTILDAQLEYIALLACFCANPYR